MAICGITTKDQSRPIQDRLRAMVSSMKLGRSGPKSECDSRLAGMGIDSPADTKDIYRDSHVLVVFDGEIYNKKELLGGVGAGDSARPIAGLIGELYQREGADFVTGLDGVFAIAIWDVRKQTMILVRDRLGVKPLCYSDTANGLAFASDVTGVLASGIVGRNVDLRAIAEYIGFNVVPAPRTAFEKVRKLNPGECLVWNNGKTELNRYWELKYTEDARGSERELADQLFARLEESVRVTTDGLDQNDVGCFLSGGTDSSSIAGLFTKIRQRPVRAFSIGFAEKRFDELSYAQLAAKHFGMQHFERIISPAEAYELIPKIVDIFDEPFANASAIPTYACIEFAKSHGVTTMLAGDGGDELFGGNERYRIHQVYDTYQRVPQPLRRVFEPVLFAIQADHGVIGKAKTYVRRSNIPNPERYCRWRLLQVFPSTEVLGDAMPHLNGDSLAAVRAHHSAALAHSELNRLLHVDVNMTLGDEDLPKVVRTAEKNGVNVRFPYLHQPLAEFSGRLPVRLKVKGFEKRYLFKRATEGFLPQEILDKKKHGFGLPIGIWLKTDPKFRAMAHDVLLSPGAYQRGYFRRQFIEKLIGKLEGDDTPYYGDLLWVFLMLELWHRKHVEGPTLCR